MRKIDGNKLNENRRKIGGKWKPIVMTILYDKPARFNKIKQLIPELSSTQLSKCMRELELNGIISKEDDDYSLTDAGHEIATLMFHINKILDSIPR